MLFCQGIVLFCQARCFFLTTASKNLRTPLWFVKSMESAARTLLKTFLPIRRQPPGAAQSSRRRPSLPQRLVIFGAGPHRFLAEDVAKDLNGVLDSIKSAVYHREALCVDERTSRRLRRLHRSTAAWRTHGRRVRSSGSPPPT